MLEVRLEDQEYSPKTKYCVLFGDYGYERVDDPGIAISMWFQKEKTNRGDAAIIAYTKDNAVKLISWAHDNIEKIKQLHAKYDNPYELEYIIDSINSKYGKDFYFTDREYGDQVDPFSFG